MKKSELFEQNIKSKKIDWISDPEIGWFMESNTIRLYYGASEKDINSILENGIYADDNGYVRCSLEPYTAYYHAMPLTESYKEDKRVVFVMDIPASYTSKNPLFIESETITNKKLYESWGKSDVEFYALADVEVPRHIPVKFIKGYMVKNDS